MATPEGFVVGGHTPGRWHVGNAERSSCIVYDQGGWAIANAITYHGRHEADAAEANARLIAAAPDLLRELEAILPRFIRCMIATGTDPEYAEGAVESARAAIAKAAGA